jgi:hypothetical protein
MNPAPGCAHNYFISRCNQVFDGDSQVRKASPYQGDIVLDALDARRLIGGRVIDEVRMKNSVYYAQVAPVKSLIEKATD